MQGEKKYFLWGLVFVFLFTVFGRPLWAEGLPDMDSASVRIHPYGDKDKLSVQQKKLSSELLEIIETNNIAESPLETVMKSQMFLTPNDVFSSGDMLSDELLYLYIYLNDDAETSILEPYCAEITDRDEKYHLAVARVEVSMLDDIASLPEVRTIRKVLPPVVWKGSALTEGDGLGRADILRQHLGFDGSGIKVGIISDGVDHWQDAKASGDLPAGFNEDNILRNDFGGDEGTAMLEIVHDIAPGAELYFYDLGGNILQFNKGIDALVDEGCNIICDDISWLLEPFFEDGLVAQHVESVLKEHNTLYLSAAGNVGDRHYQGMFSNDGQDWHDFSGGESEVKDLRLDISPGKGVTVIMQWNDKFGRSGNDYDLYLYNRETGEEIAQSIYSQDGNDDPLEAVNETNTSNEILPLGIGVNKYAGEDRELEIYIYHHGGVKVYPYHINSADSIFGHQAASDVITVGALNADDSGRVTYYSSRGPVEIDYPEPELRKKPDICGIDGVSITGAGGFYSPFYGTSAAAPHVAALAALTWSAAPELTGAELRENLLSTAVDLGNSGFDNDYGFGRADGLNSLMAAVYADHLWIKSSSPLWGETMAPVDQDIDISFSSDIAPGSSYDSINLVKDDCDETVTVVKSINGKVLSLSPESNLDNNASYTIYIPIDGVEDLSGENMDAENTIHFKTISETVDIPDPGLEMAIRERLRIFDRDLTVIDMERLSSLTANQYGIEDLSGLEHAVNLKKLTMNDNGISDLSPIVGLSNLQELYLDDNQISDLSPIVGLSNLQTLYLNNNLISDISNLNILTSLQNMNLNDNPISSGLSELKALTQLKELELSRTGITDLSNLEACSNLELLGLQGNELEDIASLNKLSNLKTLYLSNNLLDDIDLEKLRNMSGLQNLELTGNKISNIGVLTDINTLVSLKMDNNSIQALPDLSGLNNLEVLSLNENQISDISGLAGLTGLKALFMGNNQISDISALDKLTGLQILDLKDNSIAEIHALEKLYALWGVDLAGNQITDISSLVVNSRGGNRYQVLIELSNNLLDVSAGSKTMEDIETLLNMGAMVSYEPQQQLSSLQINSESLPEAFVGYPYAVKLQAIGGITPYTWIISNGQLPEGFSLTGEGVITGTPSAAGESSFNIQLTESSNPAQQVECDFNLSVYEAGPVAADEINFDVDTDCDLRLNGNKPLIGAAVEISEGKIVLDLSRAEEVDLNSLHSEWDMIYQSLLNNKPLPNRIPRLIGFSVNAPVGTTAIDLWRNGQRVYASLDEDDSGKYVVLEETAGYMITGNEYTSNNPQDYNRFSILPADEAENHWLLKWKDENDGMLKSETLTFMVQNPQQVETIGNIKDIRLNTGTTFSNISLPDEVKVVFNDDSEMEISIIWAQGDYNENQAGLYCVYGELQLSPGMINPHNLQAELNIRISVPHSHSSGGSTVVRADNVIKTNGGTVQKDNVTVEIPTGAVEQQTKVEIRKVDKSGIIAAPRTRIIGDVLEITKDQGGDFKKPVKISLSFDQAGVDIDKYQLSLFWLNEESNQWVELDNITVDTENGTVSGAVNHFTKFAILAVDRNDIFVTWDLKDIKGHWAEKYINEIVEKGIASGDAAGTFRPNDPISREEFCKLIVLAAGIDPVETPELHFSDREEIAPWAVPYVSAAVNSGIIAGYENKCFKPERNVSRAEIAAMVIRVLGTKEPTAKAIDFSDLNVIPDWALVSVEKAVNKGIISGFPDKTFRAANSATRAQAAKIISKMIEGK